MAIAQLISEISQRRSSANIANSANVITKNKSALSKLALLAPVIDTQTQSGDIFDAFFEQANQAGLELLYDDKRWLKSFGYVRITKPLLERYLKCWLDAMNDEQKDFKKQNKGRFAANTYIREAMENGN
ncbi:Uncharacterised protein [Legionella donaldsonii]|uniref:Uncharacterized protein n=1 Tax=Legionella donaldsonii TaxID=45060 RepID=A0A378JIJ5_9GAMM|nr:hypothetical protein [Legionella donaldsonii]STX44500.1 Uncharacterised protein [Legionella donaldsonii]